MAQEHIIKLTDDLDGGDATQTVRFGLGGDSYEVDLNDDNAKALTEALDRYIQAGRRITAPATAPPRRSTRNGSSGGAYQGVGGTKARLMRQWGPQNGYEVSAFGRIPQQLIDAYDAAHPGA